MPIYVYQCAGCAHTFEELVLSAGREAGVRCPKCASERLVKQPAVFATTSKGSGDAEPSCGNGACSNCDFGDD